MSRPGHSDLLADLQVDLRERSSPPTSEVPTSEVPISEAPTREPVTRIHPRVAGVQAGGRDHEPAADQWPSVAARSAAPAFELRVTPLHWGLPSVARPGTGIGLVLRSGPVQVSVILLR